MKPISIKEFEKEKMRNGKIFQEGLIRTVGIKKAIERLEYNLAGINLNIKELDSGKISITFPKTSKPDYINLDDLETILSFTENLGYSPSQIRTFENLTKQQPFSEELAIKSILKKNGDLIEIVFEPKFTPGINKEDVPGVLYHMSDGSNSDKILKMGLCPRTKNKIETHGNRIYLCKNDSCIIELIKNKKFKKETTSNFYCLFEIDSKSIKEQNEDIEFYRDLSLKDAIFIYDNISPKYIKLIQKINKP